MIRIGQEQDIEDILKIKDDCTQFMINNGIFQWDENYPNREVFLNDISKRQLYVIQDKNIIIGSVVMYSEMDVEYEKIEWLTQNGNNIYVHRLQVSPLFQKQGYGQKLMEFVESQGRKLNKNSVRLDTFSKNLRNNQFYIKRGYQPLQQIYLPQSNDPFNCYELILK